MSNVITYLGMTFSSVRSDLCVHPFNFIDDILENKNILGGRRIDIAPLYLKRYNHCSVDTQSLVETIKYSVDVDRPEYDYCKRVAVEIQTYINTLSDLINTKHYIGCQELINSRISGLLHNPELFETDMSGKFDVLSGSFETIESNKNGAVVLSVLCQLLLDNISLLYLTDKHTEALLFDLDTLQHIWDVPT